MATRKKPVAKPGKPAAAPKAEKVTTKAIVRPPPLAPQASKAPLSESGKAKDGKEKKGKKKMVRDSFTMPAPDYALIGVLKARSLASGSAVKKSELLRAGLVALAAMSAGQLIDLISAMPQVKTGRPGKKKK